MKRLIASLLLMACVTGVRADSADGREWLDKMSRAINETSFEGTFVYLHGDQLETIRILHSVDEKGQERERLVSLTGTAREVIRDGSKVTCILPDSRSAA